MGLEQILTYLTPFLVFGATWIATKIQPLIPGWLILTVVTILSAILTWVTQIIGNPDQSIIIQFLLGMIAVVISQIIKQFSGTKRAEDKAAAK